MAGCPPFHGPPCNKLRYLNMGVPRRRHCPSRRDRARAHKYMVAPQLVSCPNCGAMTRPHHACPACGTYKGRTYKVVVKTAN